jgi:hypothetical protein
MGAAGVRGNDPGRARNLPDAGGADRTPRCRVVPIAKTVDSCRKISIGHAGDTA